MSLYEPDRAVDTVLVILQDERPTYDTLVDQFYTGSRKINFIKGLRKSIPLASCPSIEVDIATDTPSWHAPRVQEDQLGLRIDITVDNTKPPIAMKLLSRITTLTTRILMQPGNLRTQIQGTRAVFYDASIGPVSYESVNSMGVRVASFSWTGKVLEPVPDRLFAVNVGQPGPAACYAT